LLFHALVGVGIAGVGTLAWIGIRRLLTRSIRQREAEQTQREWQQRLLRVSEEGTRLNNISPDVDYIIAHLIEDTADIGVIQARLEAIRRHMVSDPEIVTKLRIFAEEAVSFEVQKLILSVFDDVTRTHVLDEERRRYQ
jgi:hypothetical protein